MISVDQKVLDFLLSTGKFPRSGVSVVFGHKEKRREEGEYEGRWGWDPRVIRF